MLSVFRRHLQRNSIIPKGSMVLVAISGGGDSLALLALLRAVAAEWGLKLMAAHLDHALREESAADADFVEALCRRWSIPLQRQRVDVAAFAAEKKVGLEEAGRTVRRRFLCDVAAANGCSLIALGHHRGDQAETFLLRLLRGSGASGLTAMRDLSLPFVRPLLPFSRAQLQQWLQQEGLVWRDDPSNEDHRFTRNRIRHQLLPLLATFNPQVEAQLAQTSACLALEEEYWQAEVEAHFEHLLLARQAEELSLSRPLWKSLHPALRRRLVRHALRVLRGTLAGIVATHIESVEALWLGGEAQAELHLPQAWVARRYDRLWLRRTPPVVLSPFAIEIEGAGCFKLPDGRRFEVCQVSASGGEAPEGVEFSCDEISFPLTLRTFQPGDRFFPAGAPGSKKLKALLIDARIEKETRRRLPLLVGEKVLWVAGWRRCEGSRPKRGEPAWSFRLVETVEDVMENAPDRCR